MRKKDKFIFYFGGAISPYIPFSILFFGVSFLTAIFEELNGTYLLLIFSIFLLILGFIFTYKLHKYQISKYFKLGGKLSEKNLRIWARNWWLLNFGLIILPSIVILSSMMIFISNLHLYLEPGPLDSTVSAIKNGLVNGVKECVISEADNQTTRFGDVQSFSGNYSKFQIESLDPNSCYKAKAVPKTDQNTWFEIEMDENNGEVFKRCGDSSKPGCDEGNTW